MQKSAEILPHFWKYETTCLSGLTAFVAFAVSSYQKASAFYSTTNQCTPSVERCLWTALTHL